MKHFALPRSFSCFAFAAVAVMHLVMSSPAAAQPKSEEFLERARAQWRALRQRPLSSQELATGETGYLPIQKLIRGQDEVSVDNMIRKLDERIAAGDVNAGSSAAAAPRLMHDGGRSSVPLNDPITVIKLRDGYVIADGHHDAYLSLYLGASTIPVRVLDDLSHLSPAEAWSILKRKDLVYLRESESTLARKGTNFEMVRDNPNRFLAGQIALKVLVREANGELEIVEAKGSKKPVWVKVNDGVPFIEFYIANVLLQAGIHYDSAWGKEIPAEIVERARVALERAAFSGRLEQLKHTQIITSDSEASLLRTDKAALKASLNAFAKPGLCRSLFLNR